MAKKTTETRRVTPKRQSSARTPAAAPRMSVSAFIKSLDADELNELRALLTPAGDVPARAPSPATAAAVPGKFPMKVRVKDGFTAFYDEKRWRSGDVFVIRAPRDFSARYMEPVDPRTPESITTGKEFLRKQHDEILNSRRPASGTELVHDEPLADTKNPLNA